MDNFNEKMDNEVIVLGSNHHNPLGIIRSLGEAGVKSYFISINSPKNFVSKSKYLLKTWQVSTEQELIHLLINNFEDSKKKPIIIPSDDYSAGLIDKNLNLLLPIFHLQNINQRENEILNLMNKLKMNVLAHNYGFLVPKSEEINLKDWMTHSNSSLKKFQLTFPCIIKPIISSEGEKSDILVVHCLEELNKQFKKLNDDYTSVIVQEYIKKEAEFGIQGFYDRLNGKVIFGGVVKKLRQSQNAPGSTTYGLIESENSYIDLEIIESFIKGINYSGIFDVEMMLSNGKIYFIEINFRNGAYGYAFSKSGVNLPLLWCLSLTHNLGSLTTPKINKTIFINEVSDFKNIKHKAVTTRKWIKDVLKSNVYLIFNCDDILPFIYKILYK